MNTGYTGKSAQAVFNNTWGHLAPEKNKTYPGTVRITFTNHGEYGCGVIVLDYAGFDGPYFHDCLMREVATKIKSHTSTNRDKESKFYYGIWDIPVSFKNYKIKFSLTKAIRIAKSLR